MAAFAAAAVAAITSAVSSATAAAGATTAVASTAATAATAGSSLFSMGSLFSSLGQGALGLMGAMQAAQAGKAEAAQMQMQADAAREDARQAELDGVAKQTSLRRDLIEELGKRDVAYAASGTDISFGTPGQARTQALDDFSSALSGAANETTGRASRLRQRASGYEAAAADRKTAGYAKGAGLLLSTGLDIIKRG